VLLEGDKKIADLLALSLPNVLVSIDGWVTPQRQKRSIAEAPEVALRTRGALCPLDASATSPVLLIVARHYAPPLSQAARCSSFSSNEKSHIARKLSLLGGIALQFQAIGTIIVSYGRCCNEDEGAD
jgi:hypothetical protein